ncbi:unnamed protein product, partial [Phaeothamnion confervicola]
SPRHQRIAQGLLVVAALGALASIASASSAIGKADDALTITAVHDLLGFPVYAALFLLLAWKPRALPGLWEILILQKAAMSVLALTAYRDADGAMRTGVVDGILTLVLIAAYLLSRGYAAWGSR